MASSAVEIITDAMRGVGALGAVDAPSGNDTLDGLRIINELLEEWSTDRQLALSLKQEEITWPAFAQFRGIGQVTPLPAGSFNLPRPLRIERATYLSGTTDIPLQIIQQDQYADFRSKQTQGSPRWLYYRPDMPQGTIFLLPIPAANTTIKLWNQIALGSFATPTTKLDLAPGYTKALRFALMVEMAPQWTGRSASQAIQDIARRSKANLKRMNVQALHLPQDSNFPTRLTRKRFDIYAGDEL